MPLQKSEASCISANPRARYISASEARELGLNFLSDSMASYARVRVRYKLRSIPVTDELIS